MTDAPLSAPPSKEQTIRHAQEWLDYTTASPNTMRLVRELVALLSAPPVAPGDRPMSDSPIPNDQKSERNTTLPLAPPVASSSAEPQGERALPTERDEDLPSANDVLGILKDTEPEPAADPWQEVEKMFREQRAYIDSRLERGYDMAAARWSAFEVKHILDAVDRARSATEAIHRAALDQKDERLNELERLLGLHPSTDIGGTV